MGDPPARPYNFLITFLLFFPYIFLTIQLRKTLPKNLKNILAILGPGILVAATGIGAGDLATAAFSGSKLGLVILWAVIVGTLFKFILNEGLPAGS